MSKDQRVNIRLSEKDLEDIKIRALEEGIPYQTLMGSILHKYVSGRLVEKLGAVKREHRKDRPGEGVSELPRARLFCPVSSANPWLRGSPPEDLRVSKCRRSSSSGLLHDVPGTSRKSNSPTRPGSVYDVPQVARSR